MPAFTRLNVTLLYEPPVSRLAVPIHGTLQGPFPALENRNVVSISPASAILKCCSGQEHFVGALQLLQFLPACPEACQRQKTTRLFKYDQYTIQEALSMQSLLLNALTITVSKWCITQQSAIDPL